MSLQLLSTYLQNLMLETFIFKVYYIFYDDDADDDDACLIKL